MYHLDHYVKEKEVPKSLVDYNLKQSVETIESIVGLKNREVNYELTKQLVENIERIHHQYLSKIISEYQINTRKQRLALSALGEMGRIEDIAS